MQLWNNKKESKSLKDPSISHSLGFKMEMSQLTVLRNEHTRIFYLILTLGENTNDIFDGFFFKDQQILLSCQSVVIKIYFWRKIKSLFPGPQWRLLFFMLPSYELHLTFVK